MVAGAGVPVVAVCGECVVSPERLRAAGLVPGPTLVEAAGGDRVRAMREAAALLEAVGAQLATALPYGREV